MARIVFFVVHEVSSLFTALNLAEDLKARGHDVSFVGLADSTDVVRARGIEFTTVFERHFPAQSVRNVTDHPGGWRYFFWLRAKRAMMRAFIDELIAGGDMEFFDAMRLRKRDLLIVSGGPYVEWPAVMAYAMGIRAVYLCCTFAQRPGSGHLPIFESVIPAGESSLLSRAYSRFAWSRYRLGFNLHFSGHAALTRKLAAK
jgi:zeaxanthin glucosyltransferase